jgi:4-cresol dehydrogenase (hydroxylating)
MRRLVRKALGRRATFKAMGPGAEAYRPTTGFDVAATYWRKRVKPPSRMDPDRDLCGAIWTSPVVPLVGRDVEAAVRIVERAAAEHGFEPMMTITVLDGRTAHLVAPVLFDRTVPGEDGRALACARRMLAALARAGYYPYRLGVNSMRLLASRNGDAVLRGALKRALDPNDILSPGRYEA